MHAEKPPRTSMAHRIHESENRATAGLSSELRDHLALLRSAHDLIGAIITSLPVRQVSRVPTSEKVAVNLLIKLGNDLRCIELLAERGYPVQAASVAASAYETAYTVAYLGKDDSVATAWVTHRDLTRPFKPMKRLIGIRASNGCWIAENGPDVSKFAIQAMWFASEQVVFAVLAALRSFVVHHVTADQEHFFRQVNLLAEKGTALCEAAKRRWPER